jgi:hypothetical protein
VVPGEEVRDLDLDLCGVSGILGRLLQRKLAAAAGNDRPRQQPAPSDERSGLAQDGGPQPVAVASGYTSTIQSSSSRVSSRERVPSGKNRRTSGSA